MTTQRIRDFARVRRGASPRPIDDPRYFGGDVGWIRIADLTASRKYLWRTSQQLSPLGESLSVRVGPGDLILSICATLGRPILVQIPACIHDGIVHIFNFDDEADAEFLYYQFESMQPVFERAGQSGTQTNLNTGIVEATEVFLPDKPTQEVIARVLATVDRAIEHTEALVAKQQRIKAGLMHDLLTRGLDAQGRLRDPGTHKFKPSQFGPIPGDWDVKPLGECTRFPITYGIVQAGPHIPGGVPYIRTGDMNGEKLIRETMLCTSREIARGFQRSEVRAGEIVCAIRATIGKVLPVPEELDGANLTQGTARISPRENVDGRFLLWSLRAFKTQQEMSLQSKGTTFAEITLTDLRKTPVIMPRSKDEQRLIAERIDATDSAIVRTRVSSAKLVRLKTGLMQDLLTGRVPVTPLLSTKTN